MASQLDRIESMLSALLHALGTPVELAPPPADAAPPPGMVVGVDEVATPRGRVFPRPLPNKGEMFMGYTLRVGRFFGGEVNNQAVRTAGALRDAATPLLARHNGDWVAAAEEWLFGNPAYTPDPAWGGYRPGV